MISLLKSNIEQFEMKRSKLMNQLNLTIHSKKVWYANWHKPSLNPTKNRKNIYKIRLLYKFWIVLNLSELEICWNCIIALNQHFIFNAIWYLFRELFDECKRNVVINVRLKINFSSSLFFADFILYHINDPK